MGGSLKLKIRITVSWISSFWPQTIRSFFSYCIWVHIIFRRIRCYLHSLLEMTELQVFTIFSKTETLILMSLVFKISLWGIMPRLRYILFSFKILWTLSNPEWCPPMRKCGLFLIVGIFATILSGQIYLVLGVLNLSALEKLHRCFEVDVFEGLFLICKGVVTEFILLCFLFIILLCLSWYNEFFIPIFF